MSKILSVLYDELIINKIKSNASNRLIKYKGQNEDYNKEEILAFDDEVKNKKIKVFLYYIFYY